MRNSIALVTGIFLAVFAAQTAQAQAPSEIQMLPPTQLGSSPPVICPPSIGTGHVLTWDGSNPIACDGGLSVDNTNKSVQLPASSGAGGCDVTHAGSMRWNNSSLIFEGCINVAGTWQWEPFGRGAPCNLASGGSVADGYLVDISNGGLNILGQCQNGTVVIAGNNAGYTPTGAISYYSVSGPFPALGSYGPIAVGP